MSCIGFKKFKNISLFIKRVWLLFFILVSASSAETSIKICLTGRIVESIGSYGESFRNAAQHALEINGLSTSNIKLKYFFYDNKPLEPIHIYQKMINENCSAIVGFEYLSDLLLVIKEQRNDKIPIFTSYASTKVQEKIPNNIFIFMPRYDKQAKTMLEFLSGQFIRLEHVLLITEINREEMLRYKEAYSKELKGKNIKFTTFDFLEDNPQFSINLRNLYKENKYRFIFLLSGATASAKVANLLKNQDVTLIGTENFGSSISPSFYTRLENKSVHAYFIRNLDYIKCSTDLLTFRSNYQMRFHKLPTILSAYTFDAVNFILAAYKNTGSIDTSSIYKIEQKGVTGAYLRKGTFHHSNNFIILSVHKDGYHYEK